MFFSFCEQQEDALRAAFEAQLRARAEQAVTQPEPSCADVDMLALDVLRWEQEQGDEVVLVLPCLRSAAPNTVLLDKGANINAKGNDGNTAHYWAVNQGHLDAVKLLKERGAQ